MPRDALLLIAPPVLHAGLWWGNFTANKPHFASLAGAVRDLAEVRILELDRTVGAVEPLEGLDDALDASVRLVGISCWSSMHYLGALAVIERLRQLNPDLPIVVGGHHAAAVPEDFDGRADWVVSGDGEQPLRGLCESWPRRPSETQRLRGAPLMAMDPAAIDWANYGTGGQTERGGVVWLLTSRGCPFRCRYCMEPLRGAGARAAYSVPETLAILDGLMQTHAPKAIAFADPLFGADRRWTAALLDGLIARQHPVTYWAQTRADIVTPALLEGFARAGFKLDFGLDTGSLAMARAMEKAPNPERYLARSTEMLRCADAVGLHHGVYLIFNYPGETPDTARETRDYIERLAEDRGPTSGWLSAQTFFILPGTESWARMDEYAERHGTEIRYPTWWRLPADHYRLATDVLPSRAYRDRADELASFAAWAHGVNVDWSARYTPDVSAFCKRFYGA